MMDKKFDDIREDFTNLLLELQRYIVEDLEKKQDFLYTQLLQAKENLPEKVRESMNDFVVPNFFINVHNAVTDEHWDENDSSADPA
ncbi:hypothetical protein AKO1_002777, partial [Acrasis kona]